ncbi:helix-turn-helix domain-containing protein [Duganella qianjiadongensis]|uniref:Helix-turn-helix domain-containing protein n=1 Tax=Duganella qianjiadongensis TaxID=2692176 RepID=A0ABW9VGL4_9BURK|nr:helix-turn-helix transcriptional regulator [Duganella qianjiadongensis]MYM38651.1 helix-turn-helix domain-containing protein [Duganella qianjiadongensis]
MPRTSVKVDFDSSLVALGASIRAKRRQLHLSQEALADSSGLDRAHMGKIERGERNVSVLNVLRIARALDMTAAELLDAAKL